VLVRFNNVSGFIVNADHSHVRGCSVPRTR